MLQMNSVYFNSTSCHLAIKLLCHIFEGLIVAYRREEKTDPVFCMSSSSGKRISSMSSLKVFVKHSTWYYPQKKEVTGTLRNYLKIIQQNKGAGKRVDKGSVWIKTICRENFMLFSSPNCIPAVRPRFTCISY